MSFPRYPKYKPSGVDWLGDVPEHWGVVTLKGIANLKSGDSITRHNPASALARYKISASQFRPWPINCGFSK
jgi:hypothetical protein